MPCFLVLHLSMKSEDFFMALKEILKFNKTVHDCSQRPLASLKLKEERQKFRNWKSIINSNIAWCTDGMIDKLSSPRNVFERTPTLSRKKYSARSERWNMLVQGRSDWNWKNLKKTTRKEQLYLIQIQITIKFPFIDRTREYHCSVRVEHSNSKWGREEGLVYLM